MRKQIFGRHFKRDANERKALFRSLASALVMHERIETTEEKAKAIKGSVEKMVTKAKKKDQVMAVRLLSPDLSAPAVKKMIASIGPRFAERSGGYTRIIKTSNRFSDNASMVLLEWVEKASVIQPSVKETSTRKTGAKSGAVRKIVSKSATKASLKSASKKEKKA